MLGRAEKAPGDAAQKRWPVKGKGNEYPAAPSCRSPHVGACGIRIGVDASGARFRSSSSREKGRSFARKPKWMRAFRKRDHSLNPLAPSLGDETRQTSRLLNRPLWRPWCVIPCQPRVSELNPQSFHWRG